MAASLSDTDKRIHGPRTRTDCKNDSPLIVEFITVVLNILKWAIQKIQDIPPRHPKNM